MPVLVPAPLLVPVPVLGPVLVLSPVLPLFLSLRLSFSLPCPLGKQPSGRMNGPDPKRATKFKKPTSNHRYRATGTGAPVTAFEMAQRRGGPKEKEGQAAAVLPLSMVT